MKIIDIEAIPISIPLPADNAVVMGIGRAVKKDAVVVKVTAEDGLVGYGESHHGRAPGAVAHLANTTLKQLVVGMDALDVSGRLGADSTRCSSAATGWAPARRWR